MCFVGFAPVIRVQFFSGNYSINQKKECLLLNLRLSKNRPVYICFFSSDKFNWDHFSSKRVRNRIFFRFYKLPISIAFVFIQNCTSYVHKKLLFKIHLLHRQWFVIRFGHILGTFVSSHSDGNCPLSVVVMKRIFWLDLLAFTKHR